MLRLLSGLLQPQSFVDEITTNESYFFRAMDQMQVVVRQLVPAMRQRRPGQPVRLLSIPCARGEEPYSLAILLREHNIPDATVELVGLDISQTCLDDARAGRYGPLALRRTDTERAARWFRQSPTRGGGRQVMLDPDIVRRVRLVRGNLLGDALNLLQPPFDIVFCENLLIYFDEPTAARALSVLNRLLAPDGWLFVDHAEWNLPRERFHMQTLDGCVGFRPAGSAATTAIPAAQRPERPPAAAQVWPAARAIPTAGMASQRGAGATGLETPRPPRQAPAARRPTTATPAVTDSVAPLQGLQVAGLQALLTAADAHYRAKRFNDALLGYEQALALAPHAAAARLGKTRALIVDDSPTNRLYLRHLCRVWEMPTEEAEDGRRGLEVYERAAQAGQPFDLVLLDPMLPEMDGLEFLERLQRRDDLPKAKILLQTSMDEVDEGRNAGKLGAEARLVKPTRRRDLLETLCGPLGRPTRQPKRAPTPPSERLDGCRVLAVEDNRVNQQVLRGILERAGCNVTLADNGSEALQHLRNDSFDLVLMDCKMPVLDCYSASRKVREIEAQTKTPSDRRQTILALTAHTAVAERQKCLDAGMDDYLSKPVRSAHLLKTVKQWWQNPAQMRGASAAPTQPPGETTPTADSAPRPKPSADGNAQSPPDDRSDDRADTHIDNPAGDDADNPRPKATDVIDQRRLNSLRDALGDIQPVLEAAIAEVPRCLGQLKQAVEMGDASTVGLVSHAMAGFLANLGATEAVARARELEAQGKQTDLTHASQLYHDVERSARCAAEALSDILSQETV